MMHSKQIQNLMKMSAQERYEYFVRYTADFEQVWGLVVGEDSWVIFKDKEGNEVFPLWPHEEIASECCFSEHKEMGATPQPIPIEAFLDECVEDMNQQGVLFGVFYDTNREALVVNPGKLKEALKEEIETTWE